MSKVVRFDRNDEILFGFVEGDVIQVAEGKDIFSLQITDETIPLKEVKILPPIEPNNLIAIGLNYKKHAMEVNKPLPEEPMMFLVSPKAACGTGDTIPIPYPEHRVEHEGELAIVIGRNGKNIEVEKADEYIFGYTICNDISDRDLQQKDKQYTRAKSFEKFKPLGPYIATNLQSDNLEIEVTVNGEVKQSSNTADMIFSVSKIVSFISNVFPLSKGDVIITGTPEGVSPLKAGDEIIVRIEGIGELANTIS